MNTIIEGNILDIKRGVICHQVNCQRIAGAGLAQQIKRRWPCWYTRFVNQEPFLGLVTYYYLSPTVCIANLYAQKGYGREKRYTDYNAFRTCLNNIIWTFLVNRSDIPIYLPYGIGCGLAGGDWNIVSKIIEEELPTAVLVQR
jgi:hypothetical protein